MFLVAVEYFRAVVVTFRFESPMGWVGDAAPSPKKPPSSIFVSAAQSLSRGSDSGPVVCEKGGLILPYRRLDRLERLHRRANERVQPVRVNPRTPYSGRLPMLPVECGATAPL